MVCAIWGILGGNFICPVALQCRGIKNLPFDKTRHVQLTKRLPVKFKNKIKTDWVRSEKTNDILRWKQEQKASGFTDI